MAFQIIEIVDPQPENILAKVSHQNNQVTATIRGNKNQDLGVGKSFDVEIDYDQVLEWNVIDDFSDDRSGIWQEQDGIHLAGRIHNVLDYGDGKTIVDVYLQNGPEFFTVTSEAMEDIDFDANTGLEIVVQSLHLYPIS
jgi:hypothetical protein